MGDLLVLSKESRMERGGALCASVLFHLLLLLVLGSSSSFDITLGERSRFDVIFWISAASAAPQGGSPPSIRQSASAPVRRAGAAVKPRAAAAPAQKIKVPRSAIAPRQATGTLSAVPPASQPPAGLAITDAPAEAVQPLSLAAGPAPPSPAVKAETVAASPEQPAVLPAKRVAGRPEPEQSPVAAPPMPVRLGAFREEWSAPQTTSSGSYEVSAVAAAGKVPSEAAAATASSPTAAAAASDASAPVERGEQSRRGAAHPHPAGAASRAEQPAPVRSEPPAQKPPEPRGIVTTSLQGDLKMIISGDSGVRLLVAFRECPKSRRDRPLRRSEARREQRIQPVMARTNQQTREAVVETARDGVYLFAAEPEHGEKAQATFTLKLFETGRRERTVEIGTRTISGKTVLARVLMRDGILWDDESAFTGSFDDSESTTKYNANTGLYWKEYHH